MMTAEFPITIFHNPGCGTSRNVLAMIRAARYEPEPILQISTKLRNGPSQGLAEFVATFGLIGSILGSLRFRPTSTPWIVGLYITSAYWFTASTSFANPAVTLARSLSDTFAGIAPSSTPAFVAAQLLGALAASMAFGWLLRGSPKRALGGTG
jgi:glycerol uptake facilitator-like aquaporin